MVTEPVMSSRERALRIVLIVLGALCLATVAAVLLPTATLQGLFAAMGESLGYAEFPELSNVAWYMLRTSSVVFFGVGLFLLVIAARPWEYPEFIRIVILTLGAWVILCPLFGYGLGMPPLWYWGDSLFSLVVLAVLLALQPRSGSLRRGAEPEDEM